MKTLTRLAGLITMLLLTAGMLYAQVSVGLRGGVNFARATREGEIMEIDDENRKFLPGPYIAVPVEIRIGNSFALQAEPTYIQKGIKLYEETEVEDEPGHMALFEGDFRTQINYLTLPVLAKGLFGGENLRFYAIAGPEVGYAVYGQHKFEISMTNGDIITEEFEEDIDFDEEEISRFDFGVIFGAGLEIKAGPGSVILDGRYNLGLYDIDRGEEFENEMLNRGIGVSLGYMLPLGN